MQPLLARLLVVHLVEGGVGVIRAADIATHIGLLQRVPEPFVVEGVREESDLLCVEREKTLTSGLWAIDPLVLRAEACALRPPANG